MLFQGLLKIIFCALFYRWNQCSAHVALTFPAARKYDLDFLDNIRTPGPCGMPQGKTMTTLLAGSVVNITWHLGYPHKGGYKLELLNDQGKPWMDLTPVSETNEYLQTDPTAQSHSVRLSRDLYCKGCAIRLKREALEWINNYTFWSCADVDIVQASEYREDCSRNGDLKNGVCVCNKLYSGSRCQYKDECWLDKDCGSHGKCIDIDATTFPKKQCYCQMGWFGKNCDKESPYKSVEDIDLSGHQKKELSPEFTLYWRVLKLSDEIEIAMKVKSVTYVSIGWRPKSKTATCKAFPPIDATVLEEGEEYSMVEPEAEPAAVHGSPKEKAQSEPAKLQPNIHPVRTSNSSLPDFKVLRGNATEVHLEEASEPEPASEKTSASNNGYSKQSSDATGARNLGSQGTRQQQSSTTSGAATDSKPHHEVPAGSDAMDTSPQESITHHVAESSNGHTITLEVTAPPLDVNVPPRDESEHSKNGGYGAGGSESAGNEEVNYGFDSPDDSLIAYDTPSSYPTSTAKNARAKRQATSSYATVTATTLSAQTTTQSVAKTTTKKLDRNIEPEGNDKAKKVVEPSAEPSAEPTAEPSAEPTAEPSAEPTAEPSSKSEQGADPKADKNTEPKAEPTAEPKSKPNLAAKSSTEPEENPELTQSEPISVRDPKSRRDQELSHSEPVKPAAEPQAEPVAKFKPHAEPVSSNSAAYPRVYPKGAYTPKADFHAMDCTDIVTGMARGTFSRITDMYTRDRSTPREDAFYGGSDSLTAAAGYEKNDTTFVIFRRRLQSNEDTDHSFSKSPMHVIWARGQDAGAYIHSPSSGLENGKPSIPDFYRLDEFKYHGHKSQRGVATIDFLDDSKQPHTTHARGEFKIPNSCTGYDCAYRATWEYNPANDSILFTVTSNNSDKWTGIGFSEDTKMPNSDAILGWVNDLGRPFIMDTWIDKYEPPKLDEIQDVNFIKGTKINGQVTLVFSRKRDTGDQRDLAFTDTSCLYMFYPIDGGVYNAVNKKIRIHTSTPIISDSKICIDRTRLGSAVAAPEWPEAPDLGTPEPEHGFTPPLQSPETTAVPPKMLSAYSVAIRLPNQTLDDAIERGSDLKMLIRERLKVYVTDALKKIDGFEKVDVTGLESEKNESQVVANMKVYIDPSKTQHRSSRKNVEVLEELKNILNATVVHGKVGRLIVDPTYLVVNQPEAETKEIFDETEVEPDTVILAKNDETLVYVIIAAAIALGILLLIQIICMCYRWRNAKKSRVSKERLIAGAGWKDYSAPGAAGGSYGYEHFGAPNTEETPKMHKHPVSEASGKVTSRSAGQVVNGSNGSGSRGSSGGPTVDLHPGETRSLNRNPREIVNGAGGGGPHYSRRSESLPRPNMSAPNYAGPRGGSQLSTGGTSLNPQGSLQPDFYFMPSQRRYSGEVVRVYVDYNNPNYSGK